MKKFLIILALSSPIGGCCFAQTVTIAQNLNVPGNVQINGNTGIAGQVLMSNGASAPAWTTVSSSTCAVGGKFAVKYTNVTAQTGDFNNALNAPDTQSAILNLSSTDYNTNSDVSIDLTNELFTINRTGLYQFEGMLRFFVTSSQTQVARANVGFIVNSSSVILLDEVTLGQTIPIAGNNAYNISIPFSFTRYLVATQTLKFQVKLFNLDTNPAIVAMGVSSGSFVSGRYVSE